MIGMENKPRKQENRTVYTTDQGRICPQCGRVVKDCICQSRKNPLPTGDGIVRVRLEKKGRGGKMVTTISGCLLRESELYKLAGTIKRLCGAGGAVKDGIIEVQGDHCDKVIALLKEQNFTAKRAGG
jgi:translation initiation factor 1